MCTQHLLNCEACEAKAKLEAENKALRELVEDVAYACGGTGRADWIEVNKEAKALLDSLGGGV